MRMHHGQRSPADGAPPPEVPEPAPRLRASVCIPTRNRADILRLTLEGLARQSVARDRLQVVVGDDGSTDPTITMLQAFPAGFDLRWTGSGGRGSGAARNAAARVATHEVLIFLDDDQIASPDLVWLTWKPTNASASLSCRAITRWRRAAIVGAPHSSMSRHASTG